MDEHIVIYIYKLYGFDSLQKDEMDFWESKNYNKKPANYKMYCVVAPLFLSKCSLKYNDIGPTFLHLIQACILFYY